MQENSNIHELIDLFLAGKLAGKDLDNFMRRLDSDKEFSEIVDAQKITNEIVVGQHLAEVRSMMNKDLNPSKTGKNILKKWWIPSIILLAGIAFYIYKNTEIPAEVKPQKNTVQETNKKLTEEPVLKAPPEEEIISSLRPEAYTEPAPAVIPEEDPAPVLKAPEVIDDTKNIPEKPAGGEAEIPAVKIKTFEPEEGNPKPEKVKEVAAPIPRPCEKIETSWLVETPCKGESTGSFIISEKYIKKGGAAPYSFILINPAGDSLQREKSSFDGLSSGYYNLVVKDRNNCITTYNGIYIDSRICKERKSYSINPGYGETFKYEVDKGVEADFIIYSPSGKVVYREKINFDHPAQWNGKDMNGQKLSPGVYMYVLISGTNTKESGDIVLY